MNEYTNQWQNERRFAFSCGAVGYDSLCEMETPGNGNGAFTECGPVFEFMGCWFDLYKNMASEELDVFKDILRTEVFHQNTSLSCQGMAANRLYFINRGKVRLVRIEKGARFIGPDRGMGDVVCADTFFDGSPSRYSAMALAGTQVDYLDKDDVLENFGFVPGLIGKLRRFCLEHDRDFRESQMDIMEKRNNKRYMVSGLMAAKLLDEEGFPTGKPFRGELLDISEGGFCFSIRLTREKVARKLEGRSVVSLIKIQPSHRSEDVFWGGRIVHVRKRDDLSYTVHLKGDNATSQLSEVLKSLGSD